MTRGTNQKYGPLFSKAAERLRAWLDSKDKRQEDLASLLKTNQQQVSRYLLGHALPPLKHALALEKETEIPVSEWLRTIKRAA